ncbi:MAG: heme-copper oxidase subunit III [Planctomycetes bacterium]|nr:heme-copper oxidase subunit III [Planctomycetota bacterium]
MSAADPAPRRLTPFDNPIARFLAGRFGVGLFLISLGMLFAATLFGFLVIRIQNHDAWPNDLPGLPSLLWVSTVILMLSSVTMQGAVRAARGDHGPRLTMHMTLTLILALSFLALQSLCWHAWFSVVTERWNESAEYRFALTNFYILTGLHALHVVGGLVPITLVTRRALGRGYSPEDCAGVAYCAMYWHFLDGVWVILFATLLIGT